MSCMVGSFVAGEAEAESAGSERNDGGVIDDGKNSEPSSLARDEK